MERTLPGILLAAVWVALLLAGPPLFFHIAMIGVAAIAAKEYLNMIFQEPLGHFSTLFLTGALFLPLFFVCPGFSQTFTEAGFFLSFFLLTLYFIRRYGSFEDTYNRYSRMVFGLFYVGGLSTYLVLLRYLDQGGAWLIVLTAITAGSDSGAYFFGCRYGKRKLCPLISPKKTIEGAVGGLVVGVTLAMVLALLLLKDVNWLFLFVSSIILTGVGILGDLTESIIKRGTGIKDSGTLLAGHGGVLDRIDSLLLAAPVMYYLLIVVGGK